MQGWSRRAVLKVLAAAARLADLRSRRRHHHHHEPRPRPRVWGKW